VWCTLVKLLNIELVATSRLSVPLDTANDRTTASNGHAIVVRTIHRRLDIAADTSPASAAAIIADGAAITEK
jgi:hypothetical protein